MQTTEVGGGSQISARYYLDHLGHARLLQRTTETEEPVHRNCNVIYKAPVLFEVYHWSVEAQEIFVVLRHRTVNGVGATKCRYDVTTM